MKKIIQRTHRFEKSYKKLNSKTRNLFLKKLALFIDDEFSPSLKVHQLKGKRKNEYSFSITHDIRAIYEKTIQRQEEILIFKFIDIGGHGKVY